MYTPKEIEVFSMIFDDIMRNLEIRVMGDIIRRIRINGEITRSADWQLYRLYELGESKKLLNKAIEKAFSLDESDINKLYQSIIGKGYARDETLYKAKGKLFIPFEKNEVLQQYISAIAKQTAETMKNISQSLGFAVKRGDKRIFRPVAKYYQTTLDNAINGIAMGVFDYNTVLKQTVSEMANSGLRTVDYETGWSNRVDAAARRAVMTGLTQVTAKIQKDNAEKLETDMFEVSWHSGARPSHQVWQGRWYSWKELESICGLGSVTGLCGANCYHSYYPVIPGISVPTYTEKELDEMNRQENIPIDYNGRQYTKYEALQRQRQLETRLRAERQKIKLLQDGGADETDIMLARAKYRGTSQEYTSFSKAMDLPQQRQRVTIDGLGSIGAGKYKIAVDFQKIKARYKDSEGLFITFDARTPDKGRDVIKPHNIIKNLNKSDIGKEMLEFIKNNNIPVYLSYGSDIADEGLLGYYDSGIITVFVDNTKSVNETACIIVHEATHAQIDKPNTKNQELKCYKNEYIHRGIKLTDEIIQSIIKHIDDSYPYLEWE